MTETTVRDGITEHWAVQLVALGVTLRHLHCETGPARTFADGTREWWRHGLRHREDDLPAVEDADGTREWWHSGWLHREGDQPARRIAAGALLRATYWNSSRGEHVLYVPNRTVLEWWSWGMRHRVGAPAIYHRGDWDVEWWCNGRLHRDGGPAIECEVDRWYRWGQVHRIGGPAIMLWEWSPEWRIYGRRVARGVYECAMRMARRPLRRRIAQRNAAVRCAVGAHLPSALTRAVASYM